MTSAYLVVATLTLSLCLFSAAADFARWERVGTGMDAIGVPRSWLPWLGVPKAAAALGLLIGFWYLPLAMAAATGLVLFFVAAIAVHRRARDYAFGGQHVFLLLAAATLVLAPFA